MSSRLPPQPGEWIDRSQALSFFFEGQRYQGFVGDTISSALLASGVRVLGRSFKYHRPRGVFSLSGADANVMMEDASRTNFRGDDEPLREGLDLWGVNTLGGVKRDLLSVLGWFSAFTPVGFVYKSMHTPRALFPFYEKMLRRLAGLGRVRDEWRPSISPKEYAFCDVLVVGAGPAGVAAANVASSCGARVILAESSKRLAVHVREPVLNDVSLRLHTTCVGIYNDRWVALSDQKRLTKVRARAVVVATGCQEQPAVFANNDLPGIILGDAARNLIERYAVCPAEKPVIFTAGTEGYRLAHTLVGLGKKVAALIDLRDIRLSASTLEELASAGVPHYSGYAIVEAKRDHRKASVGAAVVRRLNSAGDPVGNRKIIPCGGIIITVSVAPRDVLLRQAGCTMAYNEILHRYTPEVLSPGVYTAGSVMGTDGVEASADNGRHAGIAAASYIGLEFSGTELPVDACLAESSHPYPIFPSAKGKAFIDLDEDVTTKDIKNAVQEGYDSSELLKRYATIGMGPSQGKHSNLNALRFLARLTGQSMNSSRLTTARPFTDPVPMAHLAGRSFTPIQQTPIHDQHKRLEAKFMYAGTWLRPAYYRRPGMRNGACIAEEVKSVHSRVGLIDVGTLGKLEISGRDAIRLLERVYTGRFARLSVGMTRYGVMCDETGVIIDDGVIARIDPERFYVSTTSSGADQVYRELQRWAAIWSLDVTLVNATSTYGAINIAGPLSRQVLSRLTEMDLSPASFPYLGIREGTIADAPARVSRVGFVGELGYEIHVPASLAAWVWDSLMEAGKMDGIVPVGIEAQRILRLVKGHLIVSQDTDGLTDPFEAGLGWAVKMDKPFFVGKRSLEILIRRGIRRQLVGFTIPSDLEIPFENHLIVDKDQIVGRVTSVASSHAVGCSVGLAFVSSKFVQPQTRLYIKTDNGEMCEASVAPTPFIDPEGCRLRS